MTSPYPRRTARRGSARSLYVPGPGALAGAFLIRDAGTGPRRLGDRARQAIRLRHLSPRTEQAYLGWMRLYHQFHGRRNPLELGDCPSCWPATRCADDTEEKKGQVAHLDRDASNGARENLVFLCFDHHDQYDSRTSQSKGLTVEEVRRYRAQLDRFVAQSLPLSDVDVARALLAGLDRPAFRTSFRQESSLPRFRAAIAETISAINTGKTPSATQLPSKADVRDPAIRAALDGVVQRLVALRGAFDDLVKEGEIRPCGCQDPDCPVHMLSDRACREMDRRRHELLLAARAVDPSLPVSFYDMG